MSGSGFGEERPAFEVDHDVAIVNVSGVMLQEAFSLCGFTIADGYDAIGLRSRAAFGHDSVGAVQVHMNSPGGVCIGGHELMLEWQSLAIESGKPLDVWVNGSAYSMAMWLSAGAGEVFIPHSGGAGSIGVITTDVNVSGVLAKDGVIPIVAADPEEKIFSYGANLLPPQKEQHDRMQARVSAMMDLFAEAIGSARRMSPAEVRGLKAKIFMGKAAVEVGLADAVMGRKAALDRTRAKIKRKAYSMPKDEKPSPYGAALIKLLGLQATGNYNAEDIERAAIQRADLAELGGDMLQATCATDTKDAKEIVGLWQKSHAALPKVQGELAKRETQLAVSTGRILPKDAYATDATDREYPALPALHPEIASKSVAVLRARFESASAVPETMPTGKPRAPVKIRQISEAERLAAKKAGLTEDEYIKHLAKYDNASGVSDAEETDE